MQQAATRIAIALSERCRSFFEILQQRICTALEEVDGVQRFNEDRWERAEGGGGLTRVMENGAVFEKAGVNTSTISGMMPEVIARKMNVTPGTFFVTGISLVIHPRSPMVPTVHANYRYFEKDDGDAWFGGGSDLTPYYPFDEDTVQFHATLKRACDAHEPSYYPRFKRWCDEYFFIKHRGETRGVGGIFFDYLRGDAEKVFSFVQSVGDVFIDSYLPVVRKRMHEPWGEHERNWQLIRRGRYVEFNLIYDRGTTFGLETGGRTESILMSLPPLVQWRYDMQPENDSREARLLEILKHPQEWVR
jgi:coproporphyrinogen III oxidase